MNEINDFFDFGTPFNRVSITPAVAKLEEDLSNVELSRGIIKRDESGTEYVAEYQKAELDQIVKTFTSNASVSGYSGINDLDSVTDYSVVTVKKEIRLDDIYNKYDFIHTPPNLPIIRSRQAICKAIDESPVIVLQGSTGCGKTTQVPQMILDEAFTRKEYCNIVVTQPRRIAAQSIAQRVCAERSWELGSVVGYQVGLKARVSEDTRLLYCTTGVLLEKLIKVKTMQNYTHIVLDEVHERDQDMDFLFIVVRRLLSTNSPHVKVILMSATIEAPLFAEYFQMPNKMGVLSPAPIINVEKKGTFTVKEFYLEHLEKLKTGVEVNIDNPTIDENMYQLALKLCIVSDRLDSNHDAVLTPMGTTPAILIFLPGYYEIEQMVKMLTTWQKLNNDGETKEKYLILPLHSSLTAEEQQRVFRPCPVGVRKIIISTNIAESSITVPDVKYVIDFCLTKQLMTDTNTNFTSLKLDWASRSNCRQRAGRAGRIMDGRVYRLVPKLFYQNLMNEYSVPEMLRSPLENVVLKAKILDMGPPQSILALAMDQPKLSDIDNTILILKEVGALLKTVNGIPSNHDGDLSFIGRVMANLPVDVHIARLIIFGYCFSVLDECIIIGAGLTVKSIFAQRFNVPLQNYTAKLAWSDGSGSDLFAILKAYKTWCAKKEQGIFADESIERQWIRRYSLSLQPLHEVAALIKELRTRLDRLGIKERSGVHRASWTPAENNIVLKIVIAGAFYPRYFFRPTFNEEYRDRDAYHVLNGRDPCNTIYYTGFDPKYIGPLYTSSIKELLKDCTPESRNMLVSFDNNSQKVFVTFRQNTELYKNTFQDERNDCVESLPGKVVTEVYKAVKKRKLQLPSTIKVMAPNEAVELAEAKGLGMWEMGAWVAKQKFLKNIEMVCIPRTKTKYVHGSVTQVISIDKFWFRSTEEESFLRNIFDELNQLNSDIEPFENTTDISLGQILAAPYNGSYYRARVEYINKRSDTYYYKVFFIDIGNYSEIEFSSLRQFRGVSAQFVDIPPRVFECRLAEIRPSSLVSHKNVWTPEALDFFEHAVNNTVVRIDIYSVVNGIANVILKIDDKNLNEILIEHGFAQASEESYMSKMDHESRIRKQAGAGYDDLHDDDIDEELKKVLGLDEYLDIGPPPASRCKTIINLRGPHSPLESTINAAMKSGINKLVTIEPHSVNSVLLDSGQDTHERLIVAASITESSNGNGICARSTTIMPNIPGFGALVALIFCPYMELKRDKYNSRYVSILSGLGSDPLTGRPIFEEHDILFYLDVDITPDDLTLINKIRFSIDSLLYTTAGQDHPYINDSQKNSFTIKIKQYLIQLFEKDRQLQAINHGRHVWNLNVDSDDILETNNIYGNRTIFPLHNGLRLEEKGSSNLILLYQKMYENCKELYRIVLCESSLPRPVKCKLCEQDFSTIPMLRIHLYTRLHRDREKDIGYQ